MMWKDEEENVETQKDRKIKGVKKNSSSPYTPKSFEDCKKRTKKTNRKPGRWRDCLNTVKR